jgi:hypothetical protein
MRIVFAIAFVLSLFAVRDASASEPCCNVTSIDARSGVVSARENASGRTIRIRLDSVEPINGIKVGQLVDADFKTMKATVRPAASEPCCAVTAVNARTNVVTVKDKATGRTSELTVRDATLFGTLKVGQTVDANAATGSIAVAPTGTIVN